MGDVAMTAPVIDAVLEQYPDIRIVMLSREFYAPFFKQSDRFVVHNINLDSQHNGFRGVWHIFRELRSHYKFDFIIDLQDKIYSKILRRFFGIIGVGSFHIDKGRNEKKALTRKTAKEYKQLRNSILRYADVFAAAGLPVELATPERVEREIPEQFGAKTDGRWIGFAPFAQHAGKRIDIETARDVIALIGKSYPTDKVFIFGGGAEEKRVADEFEAEFENCTSAVGKVRLKQEMDLIANLDVMISMDSSAMHIASLVGVRVVSVWGATHPFAGFLGMGQSLSDVVQVEDLKCRPCSVYGHKPCYRGDYACLRRITATMIVAKI